jgi:hypothetical protein
MPTNPGTVDEKPVLLAVLFGDVAIAGVKVGAEGAGMLGLMEIWEPFLRVYWLRFR